VGRSNLAPAFVPFLERPPLEAPGLSAVAGNMFIGQCYAPPRGTLERSPTGDAAQQTRPPLGQTLFPPQFTITGPNDM